MARCALLLMLLVGCASTPTHITETPAPVRTLLNTQVAFGDGTHVVPDDVVPGTYRTVGYTESCYWVRFSGFSGGLEDWIGSSIGPGYAVVTIGPDDAGFDSRDCGDWTSEIVPVTTSRSAMGEGTYVVGTDIDPGSWRAEAGENCYWARLSGFGGTEDEILEQQLTSDGVAPVVTIAATDIGFTSNGCGSWRSDAP